MGYTWNAGLISVSLVWKVICDQSGWTFMGFFLPFNNMVQLLA